MIKRLLTTALILLASIAAIGQTYGELEFNKLLQGDEGGFVTASVHQRVVNEFGVKLSYSYAVGTTGFNSANDQLFTANATAWAIDYSNTSIMFLLGAAWNSSINDISPTAGMDIFVKLREDYRLKLGAAVGSYTSRVSIGILIPVNPR